MPLLQSCTTVSGVESTTNTAEIYVQENSQIFCLFFCLTRGLDIFWSSVFAVAVVSREESALVICTLGYVGLVGVPLKFERQGLLIRKFIGRLVWDFGISWGFHYSRF